MNKRVAIIAGLLLLLIALWLQFTSIYIINSFISRLDDTVYDLQLRTQLLSHNNKIKSPIVIVDIDDKSLAVVGRWPWSRNKLAELINNIKAQGAVVIALDMMFSEKENNIAEAVSKKMLENNLLPPALSTLFDKIIPQYNYDIVFAKSLSDKDVVLGMTFLPRQQETGMLPPPLLTLTQEQTNLNFINASGYISNIDILQQAGKNSGFINVYPDIDGIIRHVALVIRYKNNLYGSLAFEAVKLYLLQDVELITASYQGQHQLEGIKLGDRIIPVDPSGQMIIPFRGKSFTFPYFSALNVLQNKLPQNAFDGKIVFIGTSATGVGDFRATAIAPVFPGVEIQATVADAILSNHYIFKPAWTKGAEIFFTILVGLLGAFLFPFLGPRAKLFFVIMIPSVLILGNNIFWVKTGFIISMLIPILLFISQAIFNIIFGYFFETRRREKLKTMFGQYVPEEHIDEMLHSSGSYALYGENRNMTVMFSDIRNFTSISEPMTASELKNLLDSLFTPMTAIIFRYKGTIDKYIGDSIMAFWGAPLRDKFHAKHALSAAIAMQRKILKLKPLFLEKGWGDIEIGIGLNTGTMSVGDMGSQFRRNYTVLGDAVNLGSRLETLTKFYGVKIIASQFTQQDQTRFLFRKLDRVLVKGKSEKIEIYEVITKLIYASKELQEEVAKSNEALECYFNQDWVTAENLFRELLDAHPDSKFYQLMITRLDAFTKNPPPPEWDGVFVHLEK